MYAIRGDSGIQLSVKHLYTNALSGIGDLVNMNSDRRLSLCGLGMAKPKTDRRHNAYFEPGLWGNLTQNQRRSCTTFASEVRGHNPIGLSRLEPLLGMALLHDTGTGRAHYAALRLYELTTALARLATTLPTNITTIRMAPASLPKEVPVDDPMDEAREESAAVREHLDAIETAKATISGLLDEMDIFSTAHTFGLLKNT